MPTLSERKRVGSRETKRQESQRRLTRYNSWHLRQHWPSEKRPSQLPMLTLGHGCELALPWDRSALWGCGGNLADLQSINKRQVNKSWKTYWKPSPISFDDWSFELLYTLLMKISLRFLLDSFLPLLLILVSELSRFGKIIWKLVTEPGRIAWRR